MYELAYLTADFMTKTSRNDCSARQVNAIQCEHDYMTEFAVIQEVSEIILNGSGTAIDGKVGRIED